MDHRGGMLEIAVHTDHDGLAVGAWRCVETLERGLGEQLADMEREFDKLSVIVTRGRPRKRVLHRGAGGNPACRYGDRSSS
jgi:hypothetical protein